MVVGVCVCGGGGGRSDGGCHVQLPTHIIVT